MALMLVVLATLAAGPRERAPWEKAPRLPAESEFLTDRQLQPQNHFLLDGAHGFVAGREFYHARGDQPPFLWDVQPFLRLWPDRSWLDDSSIVSVRARVGNEVGDPLLEEVAGGAAQAENHTPFTAGTVDWGPSEEVRLHAGFDQNDHFSYRRFPARLALAGPAHREDLAWLGGNLPPRSSLGAGGAWTHRGAQIAAQYHQGWAWTPSPASGVEYPWEGWEADFIYRVADEVDISVRDQEWEDAAEDAWYSSAWRRSEVTLGFHGQARGGWLWRLELGYQHRNLSSDSAFLRFEDKSYPWRFRYRQAWSPRGSEVLQVSSRGVLGVRDRVASIEHVQELRQTLGRHEPAQIFKGYYRESLGGRRIPTEYFQGPAGRDSARVVPAAHERGAALTLEYRYRREAFLLGAAVDGALDWSAPVFRATAVDSFLGGLRRGGEYRPSRHALRNGSTRVFASGGMDERLAWRLQAGLREFSGNDADSMEFRPSPWWVSGGGSWKFPSDLRLEAGCAWMGPKEVRGWGPLFKVPAHFENDFGLAQSLFADRVRLSASFLHAFGEEVLEHPNGNPLRFRILVGAEGNF